MQRVPLRLLVRTLPQRTFSSKSHAVSVAQILDGRVRQFEHVYTGASVLDVVERMSLKGVGSLVVLGEQRMEGIVTERDVLVNIPRLLERDNPLTVDDIMTKNPITVDAAATVAECMAIMTHNAFRHLPVTDEGELVGVLSIKDLVRQVSKDHQSEVSELNTEIQKLASVLGSDLDRTSSVWTSLRTRWRSLFPMQMFNPS